MRVIDRIPVIEVGEDEQCVQRNIVVSQHDNLTGFHLEDNEYMDHYVFEMPKDRAVNLAIAIIKAATI